MVETDSLSFILSCCSIPFYISGLIGNVLVIRIVHKTREMHTPTNYLLVSMAVSDVFTIMMVAAHKFAFSQYVNDENFGHLVCEASASLQPASRRKIQRFAQAFKNRIALKWRQGRRSDLGDKCFCIHSECLLSRIRSKQSRSLSMCWSRGFKYQSSVEDSHTVFDALFLIQSVITVFCYGSLIRSLFSPTQFAKKLKPLMAWEARRRRNLLSHSF